MMTTHRPIPTSPEHHALRGHLRALYAASLGSDAPSDHFLAGYLRKHKEVRGAARAFLGATLFAWLRMRVRTLMLTATWRGEAPRSVFQDEAIVPGVTPEREANLAMIRWLVEDCGADAPASIALLEAAGGEADSLAGFAAFVAKQSDGAPGDLALETSIPPFLLDRWTRRFGQDVAAGLARSMGTPAPLDLRANPIIRSREALIDSLNAGRPEPLALTAPHAPLGVRLRSKLNLQNVQGLELGCYEIQDEGSQLVVEALAGLPEKARVLDACAGAGGKALNIAARFPEATRIDASDNDQARLEKLAPRAADARATAIKVMPGDSLPDAAVYDAVLVDAPCLGLGRLRRDPASAWRGSLRERIALATAQQRECLAQYAPRVRPSGLLVYAACSFEEEETAGVVEWMREKFPDFAPDPLPGVFKDAKFDATRSADGSSVTLLPSLHGTDGFFIARWRRSSAGGDWRKFLLTPSGVKA